ncbi:MAG: hypothetical protein AAF604_24255 [Acidobacteriota bacterium]
MRCHRAILLFVLAALVVTSPALAQGSKYIQSGVDVFQTATNAPTGADFSTDPIPAGFFCPGSDPFKGTLKLLGLPLVTSPPGILGGADTIVERLQGVDLSLGYGEVPIVVRAMNLYSPDYIGIYCPGQGDTRWRVDVCLCECQETTKIQMKLGGECDTCGFFTGELAINVCLTFTNLETGEVRGPISHAVNLGIKEMPWCMQPGAGGLEVKEPFKVDSDCDGRPDLVLPGTTNFHPGWTCDVTGGGGGGNCWQDFAHLTSCHEGPAPDHQHCINPVCGKERQ